MNILFVVPYVPSLIRVRPYNLIRGLAARGHSVTVAAVWSNEREREGLPALESCCHQVVETGLPAWRSLLNCLQTLPTRAPLQAAYSWDAGLARRLDGLLAAGNGKPAYDVIHVEHLRGARYGLHLKSAASRLGSLSRSGRPIPVIWDSVDSISLLFRKAMVRARSPFSRLVTRFELGRTEPYEGWLVNQFDRVLVTSPADRQALLELSAGRTQPEIHVLRNGVDLAYFTPGAASAREPATLVVSGKMSYHANVTMALHLVQDIMPHVWSERPDAQVRIVGKDPPREIQDLAKDPKVTITGTVSDLRPHLQQATLAAAPIAYGVGIQNKVLEAMACATPVVATPQAVSALNVRAGVEALVAQEPAALAGEILKLLNDPRLREEIGQAGRRYVETQHDWGVVAGQLEQIYAEARAGQA